MAFHPPSNLDEILALVAQTEATGTTLAELVIQIDIQLAKIDEALGKLQPWKSGKLRIKWWKNAGNSYPVW